MSPAKAPAKHGGLQIYGNHCCPPPFCERDYCLLEKAVAFSLLHRTVLAHRNLEQKKKHEAPSHNNMPLVFFLPVVEHSEGKVFVKIIIHFFFSDSGPILTGHGDEMNN